MAKELQSAKLLDDGEKLPNAIKKLVTVASSADAKKAAEAVLGAQKDRDDARAALAKAETEAKKAAAEAKAAMTDADKAKADAATAVAEAKKAADDKAKTAVDDATKDLKKQLADNAAAIKKAADDAAGKLATARADAEAAAKTKLDAATARADAAEKTLADKLKAAEEKFATELAAARAGGVKPTQPELEAADKATRQYADGLTAYFAGRYADAETALAAATANAPADARYWYYLGLARTRGGLPAADDAFKKGADMGGPQPPAGEGDRRRPRTPALRG